MPRKQQSHRPNGEGSIYARSDGRFEVKIASTSMEKLSRKSYYVKTQAEASRLLRSLLLRQEQGKELITSTPTMATFLDQWLNSCTDTIKPSTWHTYAQYIRLYLVPTIGSLQVKDVRPAHLIGIYEAMRATGKSATTTHHLHAVLHKAFKSAVRWGLVDVNPADLVDAPRVVHHELEVLSPADIRRFLEVARGDRLEALYVLALTAGLRRGELLALKWQDVDLAAGSLSVNRTLLRVPRGGLQMGSPKTSSSKRTIILTRLAIAALQERRRTYEAECDLAANFWHDNDLIFCNSIGNPIEPGNLLRRSFWPLLQQANIAHIRFHDLRHSAATMLMEQGISPKVVSEILGHSSISITLDLYSHVSKEMQQAAAASIDSLLGSREAEAQG